MSEATYNRIIQEFLTKMRAVGGDIEDFKEALKGAKIDIDDEISGCGE